MKKITRLLLATLLLFLFSVASADIPTAGSAPQFSLPNLSGKQVQLADFKGKIVVLEWFNEGCPFVKKHYESGNMQKLQKNYTNEGVVWLTIVSSAPGKQGNMKAEDHQNTLTDWKAMPSHFLVDADGKVGKMYGAKTTPHMYIVNKEGKLVYQGAIDDKRSTEIADIKGAHNYVATALDSMMEGKKIQTAKTKPYGCSVKY